MNFALFFSHFTRKLSVWFLFIENIVDFFLYICRVYIDTLFVVRAHNVSALVCRKSSFFTKAPRANAERSGGNQEQMTAHNCVCMQSKWLADML